MRAAATQLSADAARVGVNRIGERKYMHPALKVSFGELVAGRLHPSECRDKFKHWQGPAAVKLGGVDMAVRRNDGSGCLAFMELKWGDIDWAILDFFKMTTGRVSPGADACYLIAGEPLKVWKNDNPVAALFRNDNWESKSVLNDCRKQWIGDGREYGKLTQLPPQIATMLVVDQRLTEPLDGWRNKAIRVEPKPLDDHNWPTLVDGAIP